MRCAKIWGVCCKNPSKKTNMSPENGCLEDVVISQVKQYLFRVDIRQFFSGGKNSWKWSFTTLSRCATNVGSFWLCFVQRCAKEHQPWGVESGKYVWIHILISDSYGIYPENKGYLDFGGPFVKPSTAVSFRKKKWKQSDGIDIPPHWFQQISTQGFTKETGKWFQHHVLSETILSKSNFFVVVVLFEKWSMDPSSIGSGFTAGIFQAFFLSPDFFLGVSK